MRGGGIGTRAGVVLQRGGMVVAGDVQVAASLAVQRGRWTRRRAGGARHEPVVVVVVAT